MRVHRPLRETALAKGVERHVTNPAAHLEHCIRDVVRGLAAEEGVLRIRSIRAARREAAQARDNAQGQAPSQ